MKRSRLEFRREMESIRHHTIRVVKVSQAGGVVRSRAAIEELLDRADRAVAIGGSVSARPDGFPSSTPGNGSPGGGKGGRRMMAITSRDDPRLASGATDWVPTSGTEAAALASVPPDAKARAARRIVQRVSALHVDLEGLARDLDRFDQIDRTDGVAEPAMCWVAQVRCRLEYSPEWDVRGDLGRVTDFAGVLAEPLDEPRRVCMKVYWFVRNHRRLPTAVELEQLRDKGTSRGSA